MSRAEVLIRKIGDNLQKVEQLTTTDDREALGNVDKIMAEITELMTGFDNIDKSEVVAAKDQLIGLQARLDTVMRKVERTRDRSKQDIIDLMQKIKAQNSYTNK